MKKAMTDTEIYAHIASHIPEDQKDDFTEAAYGEFESLYDMENWLEDRNLSWALKVLRERYLQNPNVIVHESPE